VDIRRLGSGDGALLRDGRLRVLEDAPYAFSSSYAREAELGADFWAARVAHSETATTGAIFVALDAGHGVGTAGGFVPRDVPTEATGWGDVGRAGCTAARRGAANHCARQPTGVRPVLDRARGVARAPMNPAV
jgi:hypothetical protein